MACAVNGGPLPVLSLRARLRLRRAGPLACAALLFCLCALAGWSWIWSQRAQTAEAPLPPTAVAPQVLASAAPPATPEQNLALFYATLGQQRYSEQQVRILFGLAAKAGLTLKHGEYKSGYDQASRVHTYQVVLPVQGSYAAIWRFTLDALRALPFAALDEISFRREAIGDPTLEARLRLTLYLTGARPAPPP